MTHYLDIVLTTTPEGIYDAAAGLFKALHAVLPRHGGAVGVAFPGWTEPSGGTPGHVRKAGNIGNIVRLVGPEAALEEVKADKLVNTALGGGWKGVFLPVRPVPQAVRFIRYIRDRVREKFTPAFVERRNRRRAGAPEGSKRLRDELVYDGRLPGPADLCWLNLKSSSNGHHYPLYIRREVVEGGAPGGRFNSYGLSQGGAAVPDF